MCLKSLLKTSKASCNSIWALAYYKKLATNAWFDSRDTEHKSLMNADKFAMLHDPTIMGICLKKTAGSDLEGPPGL